MLGVKGFLLNMLFIILSTFAYQIFWADRIKVVEKGKKKKNQYIITVLCGISIILCMTFPVSNITGYIYDLRKIPLVIGTFYGGHIAGILLTAVVIVYRFFLGGGGVLNTLLIYPILTCIALFFLPRFKRYTLRQKLFLSSILIGITSLIPETLKRLFIITPFTGESVVFFLLFCLINVVTTCLVIYLIEKSIESTRMRMEIHRSEKMNVLEQLTASIAHEIRNPMTTSRGFMQLLKEEIKDEKQQSYIDMAISEMDRAQVVITDYLSFAKPEMKEIQIIDVRSHIKNVLSIISPYAAFHNVEIQSSLHPFLFIKANPGMLTQCLVNLIKNAIEASLDNGKIEISIEKIDKIIVIKIVDYGVGMDEVQVKRLGTPFYSLKEKGTGLGLMICYRIVKIINGNIKVESEKGRGSCFSVILPAITEE